MSGARRAVALVGALVVLPLLAAAVPVAAHAGAPVHPVTHVGAAADAFRTEGTVTRPATAATSAGQVVSAVVQLRPSARARERVTSWARARGLVVRDAGGNVTLSGPAAVMASAFGTRLLSAPDRRSPGGPARYLRPERAPQVPAELSAVASAVIGLDTRPVYQPREHGLSAAGYTGPALRDAYAAPRDPAAGAGITVATVQFSGFHVSDLADYAYLADIPLFSGQFTSVSVDGADSTVPAGSSDEEVVLDSESVLAVAPMARQRVYVAPNSAAGAVDVFAKIADDAVAGKVQVVSTSWGHCESQMFPGEASAVQAQIQRIIGAGATLFASSGDNGRNDCGASPAAVDFPTSIPEVVSVGGTSLTGGFQTAWSGSGGGVSTKFAKPAYQSSLVGTGRLVPDVSLLADPNTGFAVAYQGGLQRVGGTSLASPLFAGLLASALSANGRTSGIGDIHTGLYAAPADAFQDVITGSNGFAAGVGYDEVTGLGAPRMGALAAALGIPALPRTMYHPIDPARIADSRTGLGVPKARLDAGQSVSITIPSSAPGVPASGVVAAVVNVTAVNPSQGTYLSVFPTGATNGTATSSINAAVSPATPNLVTVKTGTSGRITVYNFAGTVDVVLDLAGYYSRDVGDSYHSVSPARVLDTRSGIGVPQGKVGAAATVDLHVSGVPGVPASGVDAVVLNVTAVNASQGTYASVYPSGFAGGPQSSNLNIPSSKPVANLVITKVSDSGDVTFRNAFGAVDLVADVEGYYAADSGQTFVPVSPVRVLDTRPGSPLGAGDAQAGFFLVAADQSRPTAVVLNLTGVQPTAYTFLSMFPSNVSVAVGKTSSTLNLGPGSVRANLAQTATVATGVPIEQLYNGVGNVDVLADISGFFSAAPEVLPQTTVTLSESDTGLASGGVTFTANASLAAGAQVVFVESGTSAVLGSAVVNGSGTASLTTHTLVAGTHTVYAFVAARDGIAGSMSDPVTFTLT